MRFLIGDIQSADCMFGALETLKKNGGGGWTNENVPRLLPLPPNNLPAPAENSESQEYRPSWWHPLDDVFEMPIFSANVIEEPDPTPPENLIDEVFHSGKNPPKYSAQRSTFTSCEEVAKLWKDDPDTQQAILSNKSKGLVTYGRTLENSEIRTFNVSSTMRFGEDFFPGEIWLARKFSWLIGPANMSQDEMCLLIEYFFDTNKEVEKRR